MLYFPNLFRSSKKKNREEAGISYANSSFDKAPLVSNYNANGQVASRDGSLSAFTNNGAPRIPRATPVTRMDSLEMTSGASRRNQGLAGRNTVRIPLCMSVCVLRKLWRRANEWSFMRMIVTGHVLNKSFFTSADVR